MVLSSDSGPADLSSKGLTEDALPTTKEGAGATTNSQRPRQSRPPRPNYNKIHSRPLPLLIHPLPAFIPHNPISLFRLAYVFLSHIFSPPSSHIKPLYQSYFSLETGSIHVTEPATVRALWEQGFFGKGTLSRSEPTWLDAERSRQGKLKGLTAEENTQKRRQERRKFKQERAIKEQEAIDERLRIESAVDTSGPASQESPEKTTNDTDLPEVSHTEATVDVSGPSSATLELQFPDYGHAQPKSPAEVADSGTVIEPIALLPSLTTQDQGNKQPVDPVTKASTGEGSEELPSPKAVEISIPNQEHLQLSLSEAFFLHYALGALSIHIPNDQKPTNGSLLQLFRRYSYFPPRTPDSLEPDDHFLLDYVVYHHFRALGWVVRSGLKFSVDYLLYNRGPAFAHAAYAVLIIPAYVDPYWSSSEETQESVAKKMHSRNWHWLHSVNRVQSQVLKTLVLTYVEVPSPDYVNACTQKDDIGALLKGYKIREVIVRRWVPQRNLK